MSLLKKIFIIALLVTTILTSGCNTILTRNETTSTTIQELPSDIVNDVASLPILDVSSVDNYQKYTQFTDFTNTLIKILNDKSNGTFNIPEIDINLESFRKASRLVTEYGPLINNYNDVVETAIQVKEGKIEIIEFYKASAIFGIEITVIFTGVFYPFSYKTVGTLYRAVGLNRFAFDCPSCISFILSSAHWTIRTALVEESSKVADTLLDAIESAYASTSSDPIGKIEEYIKSHIGSN
jgi:hypothetical protein